MNLILINISEEKKLILQYSIQQNESCKNIYKNISSKSGTSAYHEHEKIEDGFIESQLYEIYKLLLTENYKEGHKV